jgi:hypothetical protein
LLYNYKALLEIPLREKIETEFGIALKDYSIRQQIQFLNFLSTRKTQQIEEVKSFLDIKDEKAKSDRMKAFLSLEIDANNGKRIIDIADKLDKQKSDQIFAKIGEIVRATEKSLAGLMSENGKSVVGEDAIRLELIKKTHDIIRQISQAGENDIEAYLERLDASRIEIEELGAILRAKKNAGEAAELEDLRKIQRQEFGLGELSGKAADEFRASHQEKVMRMMRLSYGRIFAGNDEARKRVERDFQYRFDHLADYRVYYLDYDGEPAAFSVIKPDPEKPEEVTSESTVVHPEAAKGAMGIAFLKQIFEREFSEHGVKVIRGVTRVDNPANGRYFEIGLVIDPDFEVKYEESGGEMKPYHYEKDGVKYLRLKMEKNSE